MPEKSADEISEIDRNFLNDVIQVIEDNISDKNLNGSNLCERLFMSNSTLYRKILSLTGMSPVEFIRYIRIQNAAKFLLQKSMNVSEAAYQVGFNDLSYFAKSFKKQFGKTPKLFNKAS